MAAEATVQSTIDKAWAVADESIEESFDYSRNAVTASQASLSASMDPVQITLGEPTVYGTDKITAMLAKVDDVLSGDLNNTKQQLFSDLVEKATGLESIFADGTTFDSKDQLQLLDTLSDAFTDTFTFGSSAGGFSQTVNDLSSFLTSGLIYDSSGNITSAPYGIPTDVETQLRQRGMDSITRESLREEDEVLGVYAARGFPLPPGSAARRIEEIRDKAQQNKGNFNRDVNVDQAKRGFEATGRYLQSFQSLQVQAKDMFMEYLRAAMQANSGKADDMKFLIDAIIQLRRSVFDMYGQLKDDRDLLLKEAIAEYDISIKRAQVNYDYFSKRIGTQVDAAVAAAQAMGNLASSAVSSQNTMATLAHETTAEE